MRKLPRAIFLVYTLGGASLLPAHEGEDHGQSAEVEPVPASQQRSLVIPEHDDWSDPNLLGKIATHNTADLHRTKGDAVFFATDTYPGCELPADWSGGDPHQYYVENVIRVDIRNEPFPFINCWISKTDYYNNIDKLNSMLEREIALESSGEMKLEMIQNYAWLMMYVGDFQQIVDRFGTAGPFAEKVNKNGSLNFAVSQAYFRLGRYKEAHPYGVQAYFLMKGSVLDTRWHLMLVELGLQGRKFLDLPGSGLYKKEAILDIFPNRDWESFPFVDVTDEMGVERWGGTGSVSFIDLDLDGWDELLWERKFVTPQVYRGMQGQSFKAIPDEDLKVPLGSAVIWSPGDVDNDGLPDIFRHCCNYDGVGPTQLVKNKGNLKFEDVTASSGLSYSKGSGMIVAWSDYNLDGYLDIVIADNWGPNRLYRNRGDGTFVDATKEAGLETDSTVGISFGDYNDDGWPDIWAQGWDTKWLYRNNKDGTFTDVTKEAKLGSHLGQKGYMSFIFDYDNDGLLDLFAGQYVVSSDEKWGFGPICSCSNLLADEGYSEREWRSATTIFKNMGDGTFVNVSRKTNFIPLGMMGSNHGDWNNDGYEDLVFGSGGPYMQQAEPFTFYENNGDGTYTNITPFEMLSLFGKGHGAAFTDFNRDGALDLAINNGGAAPGDFWASMVLKNKGNDNHWLRIKLKVTEKNTNSMAVGAKVSIYYGDGRIQVKEIQSGGQFSATNSLVLHYGLGKDTRVNKVVIRWPNRELTETVLTDIAADQEIEVMQNDGSYRAVWSKAKEAAAADR